MSRTDEVGVRARIIGSRKFLAEALAMSRGVREIGNSADSADRKIMGLNARVTLLRNTMRLVRPFGLITGLGLAAEAASGLAAGAVAATAALAPLSGAMVALPALGLAAAQGMTAWKLAMSGVTDAVGGLNSVLDEKKLAGLSPAAVGLARSLEKAKQPIRDIQTSVQDGLFPGMQAGLDAIIPTLGSFKDEMGLTGQAMGSVLKDAGTMMASGPFSRDLQDQMRVNASWLRRLGDAGLDLAHAFMDILVAARPLVDWMVRSVATWAEHVKVWAAAGRQSGKLAGFFDRTRKVMSLVVGMAGHLAGAFGNIAKAAAPLGLEILQALNGSADAFERWSGSIQGQNSLAAYFKEAKPTIWEIGRLVRDLTVAFFSLGNMPGGANLIRQLRTEVLPALVDVTKHVTTGFGPALMNGIVNLAHFAQVIATGIGPLTMWVMFLGDLIGGLAWLGANVPGVNILLAALVTGLAALKIGMAIRGMWLSLTAAMTVFGNTTIGIRIGLMLLALQETAVGVAATGMWAAITGPVGLVVLAIVAVGAALYLLYRKSETFRNAVNAVWGFIKDNWPLLVGILMPLAVPIIALVRHFGDLKDMISSVLDFAGKLASKLAGIPGIKQIIGAAGKAGSWLGKAAGGLKFPGMATGGVVRSGGVSLIGENGPELLSFPKGARVDPLPSISAPAAKNVPNLSGSLAAHSKLDLTVQVPVNIDGRKVADAVGRVTRDRVNRR